MFILYILQMRHQDSHTGVGGWVEPSSPCTTGAGRPQGQGSVSVGLQRLVVLGTSPFVTVTLN